ncbi:MAG TPA: diacylglycerol kinase family protein [Ktedonobacteraceae bacterium]|jgi:diacylglycerol kinase (ATP)|nr:diacylglycerol kinase family protein [Ktedonobacteraceae bacterium]
MEAGDPLVILNPAANRGKIGLYRAVIRGRLAQEKADYVETSRPGEGQELAMNAAKNGRPIIVVGGDGTINEVVNGILLAGRRVPLGIVAAGSGNDFACNTLKLPSDPAMAIGCAFSGRLVNVDAGKINGKYFANAFGVGLDADIAAAVDAMKTIPLMSGARLYYAAILRQLLFGYHRCPWLTFYLDDNAQQSGAEKRYVLIAVSNGPAYGAGFHINPTADYHDGLFDICTINYTPLLRALKILPIVKKGQHAGLPEITFYRARRVHIESCVPVRMQMDGETTSATSFDAEILPGALSIRLPD